MFLDIDRFERKHIAIHDDSNTVVTYGELCDFVQALAECNLKRLSLLFAGTKRVHWPDMWHLSHVSWCRFL